MTVAELLKILDKADPTAVIWASGDHCFPVQVVVATTTGDPATGRMGGDPKGSPAIMLTDNRTHKEGRKVRRKYPVRNDMTRVLK